MINTNELDRVEGATAYDNDGDKIGKIDQIYLDDQSGEPSWVTVTTGLFGTSQTFIPLQGAKLDGDDLRLGYDKATVKDAPRVDADGHLEPSAEDELYHYYGLGDVSRDSDADSTPDSTPDITHDTTHDATHDATVTDQAARTTSDEAAVTLSEERMEVDKTSSEAGRARLRKYTTTETETVSVPVTKEKLVVERNPVDAGSARSTTPIGEADQVEEITLREEHAVVGKETVAVEEVRVGKEQVTEQEQVSETLRKEHVDVDTDGVTDVDSGRGRI